MKKLNINQKKHLTIFTIGILIFIIIVLFMLSSIYNNYLSNFHYRFLRGFSADLAIFCAVCFGIALSLWFIRLVIRHLNHKKIHIVFSFVEKLKITFPNKSKENIISFLTNEFKKFLVFISKIVQKLHVLIALIGLILISIHVYIFISLGFKWTIGYILGALAAIVLVILVISGFLRIFNKGIKNHKILGISFIGLVILHILLVK